MRCKALFVNRHIWLLLTLVYTLELSIRLIKNGAVCINMVEEEKESKTEWRQVRLPVELVKKLDAKRKWKKEPYYSIIDRLVGSEAQ